MKQKAKQQEEKFEPGQEEEMKWFAERSGRTLEDFEDRCENATVGMVMIGYDPDSPF
jgi:hypothetical protein